MGFVCTWSGMSWRQNIGMRDSLILVYGCVLIRVEDIRCYFSNPRLGSVVQS